MKLFLELPGLIFHHDINIAPERREASCSGIVREILGNDFVAAFAKACDAKKYGKENWYKLTKLLEVATNPVGCITPFLGRVSRVTEIQILAIRTVFIGLKLAFERPPMQMLDDFVLPAWNIMELATLRSLKPVDLSEFIGMRSTNADDSITSASAPPPLGAPPHRAGTQYDGKFCAESGDEISRDNRTEFLAIENKQPLAIAMFEPDLVVSMGGSAVMESDWLEYNGSLRSFYIQMLRDYADCKLTFYKIEEARLKNVKSSEEVDAARAEQRRLDTKSAAEQRRLDEAAATEQRRLDEAATAEQGRLNEAAAANIQSVERNQMIEAKKRVPAKERDLSEKYLAQFMTYSNAANEYHGLCVVKCTVAGCTEICSALAPYVHEFGKPSCRTHHEGKPRSYTDVRHTLWIMYFGLADSGSCWACRKILRFEYFVAAHVMAASSGGLGNIENMRVACADCNGPNGCGEKHLRAFAKYAPDYEPDVPIVNKREALTTLEYLTFNDKSTPRYTTPLRNLSRHIELPIKIRQQLDSASASASTINFTINSSSASTINSSSASSASTINSSSASYASTIKSAPILSSASSSAMSIQNRARHAETAATAAYNRKVQEIIERHSERKASKIAHNPYHPKGVETRKRKIEEHMEWAIEDQKKTGHHTSFYANNYPASFTHADFCNSMRLESASKLGRSEEYTKQTMKYPESRRGGRLCNANSESDDDDTAVIAELKLHFKSNR